MIFISWFVYVLECRGGTLYTGITNDLERRLAEHRQGRGAKYTRGRTPLELLAALELSNRSLAQAEEHRIKKMKRTDKLKEIESWSYKKAIMTTTVDSPIVTSS
ncbi:MAG: GIY-YIG nuclease family protein [Syntrophomonas sp.]